MAPRGQKTPWPEPRPASFAAVTRALAGLHNMPERKVPSAARTHTQTCGETDDVLTALVATILSQHTSARNATAALENLLDTFANDFAAMHRASPQALARAIRVGGLSNVKAARIHQILGEVQQRYGDYSLEALRALPDAAIQERLQSFAGVGPKTASCVLLFALGRASFAVDTHVLRLSQKLGWVPAGASREQAYLFLDARVPNAIKYPLHVLLVHHGKCCPECAALNRPQRAPEGPCPLGPFVRSKRAPGGRRGVVAAGPSMSTCAHAP